MASKTVFDTLLKETRKVLGIPSSIPAKYYEMIARKNAIDNRNVTVFIAADRDGNILELAKKPGPFVRGELLYTKTKQVRFSEKLKSVKAKKPLRKLAPCTKGELRDSVNGKCVKVKKTASKTVKKSTKKM